MLMGRCDQFLGLQHVGFGPFGLISTILFSVRNSKCCHEAVLVQNQRQSELDVLGELDEGNCLFASSGPGSSSLQLVEHIE